MTSSETPGTVSRLILGALVAILSTGILMTGFTGIANDGLSVKQEKMKEFADDVNEVCEGRQAVSGNLEGLDGYFIENAPDDSDNVTLVNEVERIESSLEVECPIRNSFRVDGYYKIQVESENPPSVTVSEDLSESTGGGIDG